MTSGLNRTRKGAAFVSMVTLIAAITFVAGATRASAHDLNPSPFRGQPGSTYQAWDFVTPILGAPDGYCPPQNPGGVPNASASAGAMYFPSFGGLDGVWCLAAPGVSLRFTEPCAGAPPLFS